MSYCQCTKELTQQKNGENSAKQLTIKPTNQNHELSLNSDELNLRKCSNAYWKKKTGILKQTVILQLLLNITGKGL